MISHNRAAQPRAERAARSHERPASAPNGRSSQREPCTDDLAVQGRYRCIVADPPWRFKTSLPGFGTTREARSQVPYATMTVAEIAALPVDALAARDAHLYLWTTNTHLPYAFTVAAAWGFAYSTLLVWTKTPRGFAGFPTYNICTEYVLFCRRGTLPAKRRIDRNWWEWKRRAHSAKPEHFLDLVESVSPGPYLELFSRRHRLQWDVWGDDVNSSIVLPGQEAVG